MEVPVLGDASSAVISPQAEYELGQQVLKAYRAQMPTSSDPVIYGYLEQLITDIAAHSELDEKSFDLLVIESPEINAFAAPGRVMGVNTGIFLTAESEDQLAAIIAHELAHLSQRHIARQMIAQQNATLPTLAGILAGIALAAAGGADAGMAAITATQAAAIDSRLRFTRSFEQEADRVGIQTLAKSGRDPEAAGEMFEVMLRDQRYSRRPPEFLSTHPVTERRIADARSRAMGFDKGEYAENLDFHLVAARVKLKYSTTPHDAVKRFRSELQGRTLSESGSRYGLVLALTETGQTEEARNELQTLLDGEPDKPIYLLAQAAVDTKEKDYRPALNLLNKLLKQYPEDHAINIQFAETLMAASEYKFAQDLLQRYVRMRPEQEYAWYLLAEVHGLAGNILGVHRARAEYYILNGIYDHAERQLRNALRLAEEDTRISAELEQRLIDVQDMRTAAEKVAGR
ncbi:M48 family metalloprotease [Gilvimarinus sp. F26214L]|uniref:M48 family metalloprotease n=1 Tax=Gilvimarinus sp. DZF01 TaxID=3461371 RepID=UPI004045E6B8